GQTGAGRDTIAVQCFPRLFPHLAGRVAIVEVADGAGTLLPTVEDFDLAGDGQCRTKRVESVRQPNGCAVLQSAGPVLRRQVVLKQGCQGPQYEPGELGPIRRL